MWFPNIYYLCMCNNTLSIIIFSLEKNNLLVVLKLVISNTAYMYFMTHINIYIIITLTIIPLKWSVTIHIFFIYVFFHTCYVNFKTFLFIKESVLYILYVNYMNVEIINNVKWLVYLMLLHSFIDILLFYTSCSVSVIIFDYILVKTADCTLYCNIIS